MNTNIWPITYGAYGGCIAGQPHKGDPGVGFAAVSTALSMLLSAAFGAAGVAGGTGGGRGGGEEPGSQCDVFIGVVETVPSGGYGAGTVKKVTFNSDGTWRADGNTINVIFPRI